MNSRETSGEAVAETDWLERLPSAEEVRFHALEHPCEWPGFGLWLRVGGTGSTLPRIVALTAYDVGGRVFDSRDDALSWGPKTRWLRLRADGTAAYHRADPVTSDQSLAETLGRLAVEIARSRAKYPGNMHMLTAIVESTGLLARALLCNDPCNVRKEATQVAAIAIRLLEEGDATFSEPTVRRPV